MKISILMPVYNSAQYLHDSLSSVMNQTFTDWELIMVNDGSTDNSATICDEYPEKDERIRVIHTPNSGVSKTRNRLVSEAKGEYLFFMDSDDEMLPQTLECLYTTMKREKTDLVICGFFEEKRIKEQLLKSETKQFELKTPLEVSALSSNILNLGNAGLLNPLWNKLFKASIVKEQNILFPIEMTTGEDLVFNLDYLSHVKALSMINEPLYRYMRRQNQSITNQYVENMYEKGLEIHERLETFLEKMNFNTPNNQRILMENHLGGVFSAFLNLFHEDCPLTKSEKAEQIQYILNRHYVRECAKKIQPTGKLIQLTKHLIKINNVLLIMLTFQLIAGLRKVK